MVGIILATHGDFAKGILQSGSMIFGDQPNVAACTLQPSMGPEDIKKQMEDAIAGFENQDEVLISFRDSDSILWVISANSVK